MDKEKILKLAAKMLETSASQFSNHGCNNVQDSVYEGWTLEERQEFVKEFHDKNGDPEEYSPNHLHLADWCLMDFLADKLRELSTPKEPIIEESGVTLDTELIIITLLSGFIREVVHEGKDYEKTTYALASQLTKLLEPKLAVTEKLSTVTEEELMEVDELIEMAKSIVAKEHKYVDWKDLMAQNNKLIDMVFYYNKMTRIALRLNNLGELPYVINQLEGILECSENENMHNDCRDQLQVNINKLKSAVEYSRLKGGKSEANLFDEKKMIDFSLWFLKNLGKYSDDELAHKQGYYFREWLKENNPYQFKSDKH